MKSKGWYEVRGSRKYHYFDHSLRSLCGRWMMLFGINEAELYDTNHESEDNCAPCKRKREKDEQERKAIETEPQTVQR